MRFRVLGPLEVRHGDVVVDVGGRQPRLVLAALLAAEGAPVPVDTLVDLVWDGTPPPSASGTLQTYVSRLRRTLAATGLVDPVIHHDLGGYRLPVHPDDVDTTVFERLVAEGEELLRDGHDAAARDVLVRALGLVRGPVWAELADHPSFTAVATRDHERWVTAREDLAAAELALGRDSGLVAELAELVAQHPLRERPRSMLAIALYRAGRQADALATLADGARLLRDELGIEPDRRLRDLEVRILQHDPDLDVPATPIGVPAAPIDAGPTGPTDPTDPTDPHVVATSRPPLPELVGRATELAQLVAALDEAGGDARFVVVEGDPGIGKTRLAEELRVVARARGSQVVWGRSDEGGAAPALWPWLPVLRALDAGADESDVALADVLGPTSTFAGVAPTLRHERFEAVAERLERAGEEHPIVVLLDDLQWADGTSLELLAHLAQRLRRGVLVAATVRSPGLDHAAAVGDALAAVARRAGSRRLVLTGLPREATARLLPTACDHMPPPAVVRAIHRRAEGNPFYALELARFVGETGADATLDQAIPGNVRDVIRQRLRHLPEETLDLLSLAAIMGRDVDLELLPAAAGIDPVACLERLDPALRHRCVTEVEDQPGRLRFQHALIREVLVDALTSVQRARLHHQAAVAIERRGTGPDDAEILADHLWHAVALAGAGPAADALEHAADVAVGRLAYSSAEVLLRRAARLRRSLAADETARRRELATLLRFLEVVLATRYFGGVDEDAVSRALELARAFGDEDTERALFWFQWAGLSVGARNREARPLAEAFFERHHDDPRPSVQALSWELLATAAWTDGRLTEASEHYDRAISLIEDLPLTVDGLELEQRLVTWTFQATVHAYCGTWTTEQVYARFDHLLATWPPLAAPSICGFAATSACYLGHHDRVRHYCEIALQGDPAFQFAFWGGQALMQYAVVLASDGRFDEALETFADGHGRYLAVGARSGIPMFAATVAMLLAEGGRHDDARALLVTARSVLDEFRENWNEPIVLLAEAVLAGADGDDEAATAGFRRAEQVAVGQGAHGQAARIRAVAEGRPPRGRTPAWARAALARPTAVGAPPT